MNAVVGIAVGLALIVGSVAVILGALRWRRRARLRPKPKVDVEWEFSEQTLIAVSVDGRQVYHWHEVRKWRESDKLFIVYFRPIKPIIVVKHELHTPENVEAFRALLVSKLGPSF